jgi:tetratricopeptide (TPR) repeat protein
MHGPLSEIGLIEVLQLLERGRRSGVLRITGAEAERGCRLCLADGVIVALEPDAGDAATRAALLARHLISDAEAAGEPGMLDRPLAVEMRAQLALQSLAAMLHWRRGRFDFEASSVDGGPLSLSPDALAFHLVASETRRVDLAAPTAGFRAVPDFAASDVLASGDPPLLTPRDWRVLDLIDGIRDIATLASELDEPLEDVAACIQSLHAAAILELSQPTPEPAVGPRAAIDGGRYVEAARLLHARLAEHPDDGEAWRALGLAEVGAGRFERAIDAWQNWRASDPERAGDAAALMQAARTMVEALREPRD